MLLLDTSGLLAALDSDQRFHRVAREALKRASGSLILSSFVLAQLDHLLLTRVGDEAELALLGEVARGTYRLETFSASDVAEARAVIERYAGFGDIGLADASNVVLARRHDARDYPSRWTSGTFACCAGRATFRSACSPLTVEAVSRKLLALG